MLAHLLAATLVLAALAPLPAASQSPSGEFKIRVLHGADACVVFARDRSLRRVDLATGETTAIASEHMAGLRKNVRIKVIDEQRLFTWTEKKSPTESFQCQAYLRDATTLEPIHVIDVPSEAEIAAVSPDGEHVAIHDIAGRLALLSAGEPGKPVLLAGPVAQIETPFRNRVRPRAAFSPSGSRVAVVDTEHVFLFDTSSAELIAEVSTRGVPNISMLRFHDENHVIISWSVTEYDLDDQLVPLDLRELAIANGEPVGIDLIRLADGVRIARMTPLGWCWGDYVCDLISDPKAGTITYTITNGGYVGTFGDETWRELWQIHYGGGNGNGLWLSRVPGSDRACVSGMGQDWARVLSPTGKDLAGSAPLGFQLAGTSGDRFIVYELEDVLHVLDGETFELLYSRTEGTDGTASLLRDGDRIDLTAPEPAREPDAVAPVDQPR